MNLRIDNRASVKENVSILIVWCRLDSLTLSTRCWITIVMRSNDSTAYISHQRASLSMSILPQQHSRSHATPFLIAVILTFYVETVFAKIIVSSVRPNRGSLAGGTRVHIQVILCSLSNHDVKSTLIWRLQTCHSHALSICCNQQLHHSHLAPAGHKLPRNREAHIALHSLDTITSHSLHTCTRQSTWPH